MESLKAFFQKALRGENGYVSLLRDLESNGGAMETSESPERSSNEGYASDEADHVFENTPLVLQDPAHSNGALARRRMKGAVTRNSGRPGTERKFDTITSTEGLRTAPLGARSSGTAAYSPDEVQAARLYAMSKIDAYAPWAPICQHQTPEACARARAEAYLQSYSSAASSAGRKAAVYAHAKTLTSCVDEIHYTIIRSKGMSFEFGDCQYLDQCPRMNAGCRKVHYVKVLPKVGPAVIGVQFLKLTKFKNDPESFDILSSALKEHELRKLVASQKIWAASGRKIPDVVGQEAEPLHPRSINFDIRNFDFAAIGKFGVVMIDPPISNHTFPPDDTISDTELSNLPIDLLSSEGLIFIWGTPTDLGRNCIKQWGYQVATELIWIKTNKLNETIVNGRTGNWLNHVRETCQVGYKGPSPSPYTALLSGDTETIVAPEIEAHLISDEIYDMIDRLAGADTHKIELFGRTSKLRNGWLILGRQIPSAEKSSVAMEAEVVKNADEKI